MSAKEELDKGLECVSDQDRDLAQVALAEFNLKNYGGCLQSINKLEKSQDFKVLHNKHVAEYNKSDLKRTEQFQKSITSLFGQFHLHIDRLDDVDHCVAFYNQAVLLYHQKQFSAALKIMDKVYKFIEPMDEVLSRQVGLLLVELHLCVKQVDKACHLITYLHNHALNQNPTMLNITKVPLKQKLVEKEKKPITKATEQYLKQLDMYRVKCEILKRSIKSVQVDLQTFYQQQKDNVEVLFLMANVKYLEGDFQEAIRLLNSVPTDAINLPTSGESSTVMFYNNMGVIYHAMGKPNMACYYYQQALKEETAATSKMKGESTLWTLGFSKYHELMYNLGISLLYAGKAAQAFECLIIAVRRYHRNSRLWLRLAECCIHVHKESNAVDLDPTRKQKDLVEQVVGQKENRKIILTTNVTTDKKFSSESQSYAVPIATLEFATLCLRNAKTLLPTVASSSPVPLLLLPGVTPHATNTNPGATPSSPVDADGIDELRNGILAASAYVCICLGDYIVALEHARELLEQPRISGAHKMLGHLYAAECLVLLDKLSDALDHLNIENIKDISLEITKEVSGEEIEVKTKPPTKWFPNNQQSVVSVMQYNIAIVKTIRGQFEQAHALLKQLWQSSDSSVPAHVIMLVLYIELQLGHAENMKTLIKQNSFRQRFCG